MIIFCTHCQAERAAVKKFGPHPKTPRDCEARWHNVCTSCKAHYASLPPGNATKRAASRSYERASKQLQLF